MAAVFKEAVSSVLKNCKGFDRVLSKLKILTLDNGKCLAELKIEEEHTNPIGGLHGGLSATLVDVVSTFAFSTNSKVGFDTPTVSVDIHTSYLKGATVNDVILVDAKTIRVGRTMGFLEVDIRNKQTNDLLVKGTHTVYILQNGIFTDKKCKAED